MFATRFRVDEVFRDSTKRITKKSNVCLYRRVKVKGPVTDDESM